MHSNEIRKKLKKVIRGLSDIAELLAEKGWAERNAGNASMDVTDLLPRSGRGGAAFKLPKKYPALALRAFLVTRTGSRMRDLEHDPMKDLCVIRVGSSGREYTFLLRADEKAMPTSELGSHLAVHAALRKSGSPERAFLHTHPTELVALTHLPACRTERGLNKLLFKIHPENKIVVPQGAGLVKYNLPGSASLESATLKAFSKHKVIVWAMHGAAAVGCDFAEAYDLIDTLNKSARIYFLCAIAGVKPRGLTAKQIRELEKVFCSGRK